MTSLWEELTHPCHYPACPGNPDCYASSMEKVYYVYLLASERNGTLYVGVTNDLVRRVYEHKSGAIDGFSKQYGVKQLVWFEQTSNVHAAIAREKRIKKYPRAWKINLIEKNNPDWLDLYTTILE